MDTLMTLCVVLGSLGINQVSGLLHCIECTHIIWNSMNRTGYVNENMGMPLPPWIISTDNMVGARFSPACASSDPYNWNIQGDPEYSLATNLPPVVAPGEAVCPGTSSAERCNFMYGTVEVYLQQYQRTLKLNMYIRNCRHIPPEMENNKCYVRNTNLGFSTSYSEIRNDFQNALSFFGPGTTVRTFYGQQCSCNYNRCRQVTQGSASITVSITTILAALSLYFTLKG